MEILGNYDTKINQWVLTPKQLNLVDNINDNVTGGQANQGICKLCLHKPGACIKEILSYKIKKNIISEVPGLL